MSYKLLEWDSDFFGFSIGKIDHLDYSERQFLDMLKDAKENGINLLYWFTDPENSHQQSLAVKNNGFLADEKITYQKHLEYVAGEKTDTSIISYKGNNVNDELKSLALQSAEYSRFRVDLNFESSAYEKLYIQWIRNSLNGIFANEVLVYLHDGKISGMITLKDTDNSGSIGLIGVDTLLRGKQIGTKLIKATEQHYFAKGINILEVVTQKANIMACRFYEKNGFYKKTVENVYHFWL